MRDGILEILKSLTGMLKPCLGLVVAGLAIYWLKKEFVNLDDSPPSKGLVFRMEVIVFVLVCGALIWEEVLAGGTTLQSGSPKEHQLFTWNTVFKLLFTFGASMMIYKAVEYLLQLS